MYSIIYTNKFKKDYKRCLSRNYNIELVRTGTHSDLF